MEDVAKLAGVEDLFTIPGAREALLPLLYVTEDGLGFLLIPFLAFELLRLWRNKDIT